MKIGAKHELLLPYASMVIATAIVATAIVIAAAAAAPDPTARVAVDGTGGAGFTRYCVMKATLTLRSVCVSGTK